MALTLVEQAKLVNDPLQAGVIETFPAYSPVLQYMPFMNVNHRSYTYNQEDTLPGIAFRDFGEDYDEDTGTVNPVTEKLRIFGGHSDVDRALVKTDGNINDTRAIHDRMKAKSASLFFTKKFFKGENSSGSPDEFDGLEARLTGNQVIDAGSSSDGDELTLDMLDELMDAVSGTPDVLFMNKTMRRKVNSLIRSAGQAIETVSGVFGQQLQAYAGVPIGVIEEDEEGNDILAFNEPDNTSDGGDETCTSIYAVKFGVKEYVSGLQAGSLDVIDHGLYSGGVAYRTTIEWIAGMAIFHPRSAARLKGLKNA